MRLVLQIHCLDNEVVSIQGYLR